MSHPVSWVTEALAVSAAPMSYEALDSLKEQGIDAILNLCEEFCDLHWIQAESGFEVYYFPIPDEETPDLKALEQALEWLDETLYLGKKVLIHCRHGIGRTGTVLNAYLLRRGLGHKLAGKYLKPLRAKPQNFGQWRFVRRYGKNARKLSVREPSLEGGKLLELQPFFEDYEALRGEVEALLPADAALCGREHDRCCKRPVFLSLGEAVFLSHMVTKHLDRPTREAVVERAVEAAARMRELGHDKAEPKAGDAFSMVYRDADILCPLNELGECLVFAQRPTACLLFDLPDNLRDETMPAQVEEGLAEISGNVFFAYTSELPKGPPLRFALADVVSGKFVQALFHVMTG
jgi:protein-tyrosine phosphatase